MRRVYISDVLAVQDFSQVPAQSQAAARANTEQQSMHPMDALQAYGHFHVSPFKY